MAGLAPCHRAWPNAQHCHLASLRQQLRERGELPPGLQKHLVPVPGVLGPSLPNVPVYYQRYFAGDDLIVVDTRSQRIVAIIPDVWR